MCRSPPREAHQIPAHHHVAEDQAAPGPGQPPGCPMRTTVPSPTSPRAAIALGIRPVDGPVTRKYDVDLVASRTCRRAGGGTFKTRGSHRGQRVEHPRKILDPQNLHADVRAGGPQCHRQTGTHDRAADGCRRVDGLLEVGGVAVGADVVVQHDQGSGQGLSTSCLTISLPTRAELRQWICRSSSPIT